MKSVFSKKNLFQSINFVINRFPIISFFTIFFLWIFISFNVSGVFTDYINYCNDLLVRTIKNVFSNSSVHFNKWFIYVLLIIKNTIDGIIGIIGFIPVIFFIFFFVYFIEKSKYFDIVACQLNHTLMKYFKFDAKIFIPLITGMGCTVPAYMMISTMLSGRLKTMANVIVSFIPCSAKHTVFALFCITIFGSFYGSICLLCIYIFSFVFGLCVVKILLLFFKLETKNNNSNNKNIQKQEYCDFIEIFKTNVIKDCFNQSIYKVKDYIKNIASTILIFSLCFSTLNSFGFNSDDGFYISYHILPYSVNQDKSSILMIVSKFCANSLFAPLELPWEIVFAIISGIMAKEVSIASLGVVLANFNTDVVNTILNRFSLRVAMQFLIFMFFYMPCISATAMLIKKRTNYKEPLLIFIITTFFAFGGAYLAKFIF